MKKFTVLLVTLFTLSLLKAQEGKYAEINGIRIYYESYGDKDAEPLLLLHYWTNTSQMWKEHIEEFQKNYRVYVPDLRGHGKSPTDLTNFEMKDAAEDMLALMEYLNIKKIKAIGASYGGFTLLHLSVIKPELLESMILVGATHYWNQKTREEAFESMKWEDFKDEQWVEDLSKIHVNGRGQLEMILKKFHSFKDDYFGMNFTPPILSTITPKTLIVMGEKDLGFELAFEMHRSIPNSYLWILPNTGHTDPVHGKNIPEFLRISGEFLGGEWD